MRKIILFTIITIFIISFTLSVSAIAPDNVLSYIRNAPKATRISMIKAKFFPSRGVIKITWKKVANPVKYKYRIYRSTSKLNTSIKLRRSSFIAELEGNTETYVDYIKKSGKFYYAISVVDLSNKEIKQLTADQSYTTRAVKAYITPDIVTNLSAEYELGRKRILLRWSPPSNVSEIAKFRIYRSNKRITKLKPEFRIAEVSPSKKMYFDSLNEAGRYYYVVTTISNFKKENKTIIVGQNYTKNPVNVRFYSSRVVGIEGFSYYTGLTVDKSHPPIFFRFIKEIFRTRETFEQFDIYGVKAFKEVNRNLLSLPTLPREYAIDRNIERLTPVPSRRTQAAVREDRQERQQARQQRDTQRRRTMEEIFREDARSFQIRRQNQQRRQAQPQRQIQQQRQEQRTTPIRRPEPQVRREQERVTPVPRPIPRPRVTRQRERVASLREEHNKLKYVIREYFYKRKDYKTAKIKLKELFKKSKYNIIKNRIIYFYGRCLLELKQFNKAAKTFSALRGTNFYNKYKSEIDLMIRRAVSRR